MRRVRLSPLAMAAAVGLLCLPARAQTFVAADGAELASKGDVLDALARTLAANEEAVPALPLGAPEPATATGVGPVPAPGPGPGPTPGAAPAALLGPRPGPATGVAPGPAASAALTHAATRLVRPWGVGDAVAVGWTLRRIGAAQEGVRYVFVARTGSKVSPLSVTVAPLSVRSGCYFKTRYYCGFYRGAELVNAGAALPGLPMTGEVCEPGAPRAAEVAAAAQWRSYFRALLGGLALVVLGLGALLLWRRGAVAPPPRWAWLGLVGLTGLAFGLRFGVSPRTFLHEFYRVGDTVGQYLWTDAFQLYGETGPSLYRMVDALFGGEEQAIFTTNTVLAALSVPAVVFLDLALFGRWGRALLAGLCLCLLPLHLRFSASEELFIPGLFFVVVSLAACADYVLTRSWLALLLAMIAMSLAAQARPELLPTPFFALLLAVALARQGALRRVWSWRTLVGVALAGLLTAPRLWALLGAQSVDTPDLRAPGAFLLTEQVVFDGGWTPLPLWCLAGLGLLWGLLRAPGRTLWLVTVLLVLGALPQLFFGLSVYNARTQVVAMPFLALLAAGAYPALAFVAGARRWWRALVASACAAALGATSCLGWERVVEVKDQQEEWSFLREAVPKLQLPPGAELIAVTRNIGNLYLGAFPWFLMRRAGHQVAFHDLHDALEGDALPAPHPGLLVYIGTYCFYRYQEEPEALPYNVRCEGLRRRYRLRPLLTHRLRTGAYAHTHYADGERYALEIGFYAAE